MASKSVQDRIMHGVSSNSPLPPSVETAYYRKCIELKRRIQEIENDNGDLKVKKTRIERAIMKMRLERAIMIEKIADTMKSNPDDSDDSDSPPPTPADRPLRSKRHARMKLTPPPGAPNADSSPPNATTDPAAAPDHTPAGEARQPVFREYAPGTTASATDSVAANTPPAPGSASGATPAAAPAVNGASVQLPSLSDSLPASIAPTSQAARPYDPAYDDRANGDEAADTEMKEADA